MVALALPGLPFPMSSAHGALALKSIVNFVSEELPGYSGRVDFLRGACHFYSPVLSGFPHLLRSNSVALASPSSSFFPLEILYLTGSYQCVPCEFGHVGMLAYVSPLSEE